MYSRVKIYDRMKVLTGDYKNRVVMVMGRYKKRILVNLAVGTRKKRVAWRNVSESNLCHVDFNDQATKLNVVRSGKNILRYYRSDNRLTTGDIMMHVERMRRIHSRK